MNLKRVFLDVTLKTSLGPSTPFWRLHVISRRIIPKFSKTKKKKLGFSRRFVQSGRRTRQFSPGVLRSDGRNTVVVALAFFNVQAKRTSKIESMS